MASINADYKLRKLPPQVTLTVRIVEMKEYMIRKWIAVRLIKLAALILGCGIVVEE